MSQLATRAFFLTHVGTLGPMRGSAHGFSAGPFLSQSQLRSALFPVPTDAERQ